MGRNLRLIVALAVLATAVAVGAVNANAGDLLDSSSSSVGVNLPDGQDLPPVGSLPACANLKDHDGDGQVDLADPGCSAPTDGDESNPAPSPSPVPNPKPPPVPAPDGDGGGAGGDGA